MGKSAIETNPSGRQLVNVEILRQNLPSMDDALILLLRFKLVLLDEVNGIEKGLDQNDLESVRFLAHRVRSASLYLGLEDIGVAATRLEELIENQAPFDEILAAWTIVRKACRYFLNRDRAGIAALLSGHTKNQS